MNYLIDTHLALWTTFSPTLMSPTARRLIDNHDNNVLFSVVSLWETVIKSTKGRNDFLYEATALRRNLLVSGFDELTVTAAHVFEVAHIPPLHADPFDRLLLAQARSEGLTLLTTDAALARYGTPVERV